MGWLTRFPLYLGPGNLKAKVMVLPRTSEDVSPPPLKRIRLVESAESEWWGIGKGLSHLGNFCALQSTGPAPRRRGTTWRSCSGRWSGSTTRRGSVSGWTCSTTGLDPRFARTRSAPSPGCCTRSSTAGSRTSPRVSLFRPSAAVSRDGLVESVVVFVVGDPDPDSPDLGPWHDLITW